MKIIYYILIIIAFLLVTFFGLGSVLMADGQIQERMLTLLVVLALYALLIWFTIKVINHSR